MTAIDVFGITDADLARMESEGLLPRTDLAWVTALPLRPLYPCPERPSAPKRACDRCGIDTTRPDLCIDCWELLVVEGCA